MKHQSFTHAVSPDDYTETTVIVTFLAGDTTARVSVPTAQDNTAEVVEMFTAVLSDPTGGLTLPDDPTATAIIEDDDGKRIHIMIIIAWHIISCLFCSAVVRIMFNPTLYVVTEGETAGLMLVLSAPSDSEITVQVLTNPGSALGKFKYGDLRRHFKCALNEATPVIRIL